MNRKKIALILNGVLVFFVCLSLFLMFTGVEFMGHNAPFASTKMSMFKFFTVQSNLFLGVSSLFLFIQQIRKKEIKQGFYLLKFSATTSVFLTMMVTLCFLAPFSPYSFIDFYRNSNLFLHFFIPVISIISFVFYDDSDFKFRYTFYGLYPMILYAIGYVIYILPHVEGNTISLQYDFYGFFRRGVSSVWYVVPIMFLLTYGLGYGLWFFKRIFSHKKR